MTDESRQIVKVAGETIAEDEHSLKEPFAYGRNAELRTSGLPAAASEFIEDARIKWPFEEPGRGEWV